MIGDIKQRLLATPAGQQWQKIGIRQHHGIALPLFSLHSSKSCGIGEYLDLIPLISWCHQLGFDVIQLLPLNDTGDESSPYGAISSHALNPIHLSVSELPYIDTRPELQQQLDELRKLNETQRINYKSVRRIKRDFLRNYYHHCYGHFKEDSSYKQFKTTHHYWLDNYALFKSLKIIHHWQNWQEWPQLYRDPVATSRAQLPYEIVDEMEFHCFVQYLCFLQFQHVRAIADQHGVLLKGDIPILVNRESASVWRNPHLFTLDPVAGAPPDMYNKEGQKWGFPLYNWDAIAAQGYKWWVNRLRYASLFYHLYRIDHIVGFFRIWAIPLDKEAKEGFFIPEDPTQWTHHGETILKIMLSHNEMLPIGEDLGLVPLEVKKCLSSLGICGTKVMRWEREWDGDMSFIPPSEYPAESMTTVSTHDSETLQLWWQNTPEEAQDYAKERGWQYNSELTTEQRLDILHDSHHSGSLFHINLLQEYLALLPDLVWPDPEDERINVPGIINDLNWTYRFRPSVEQIVANNALQNSLKKLLSPNSQ